jgi:transcriptional regulator with XRE-family HTH domain
MPVPTQSALEHTLGEFLRARRELTDPEEVGIPDIGGRRVKGLRREELAMLAGVSIDYYTRLEQGRDRHPSIQVQRALGRVLKLDGDALSYMAKLAAPPTPGNRDPEDCECVRPGLERIVMALVGQPAMVVGRRGDVLAANPLATALTPYWSRGSNLLRALLLVPEAHSLFPDWDRVATECIANFRATLGDNLDDPRLTALVGELSLKSEFFRRRWARHEVRRKTTGEIRFDHPLVGELTLGFESLQVSGSESQSLMVYHARPGSSDERALRILAAIEGGGEMTEAAGSTIAFAAD